jgi:hypothetical protein
MEIKNDSWIIDFYINKYLFIKKAQSLLQVTGLFR